MIVENQYRADKYIPRLFLLFFPYVGPVTKKLNAGLKKKKKINPNSDYNIIIINYNIQGLISTGKVYHNFLLSETLLSFV